MNPHRLVTLGCTLAALGILAACAGGAGRALWPRELQGGAHDRIAETGERVAALRAARVDPTDGQKRFDTLLGTLDVDSPAPIAAGVTRIATARAGERRDGIPSREIDVTIAEMETALGVLEREDAPPAWLTTIGDLGLLLTALGFGSLLVAHRAYGRERRAIATLAQIDPHIAGHGRLASAVKETIYAERLKAVQARDVGWSAPASAGTAAMRSPGHDDVRTQAGVAVATDLPILPVPPVVFEPPQDISLAVPVEARRAER